MPIYEYKCSRCGEDFEKLVFGNQKVRCLKCDSEDMKKKFSVSGAEKPLAGTSGFSSCTKSTCSTYQYELIRS